MGALLAVVAAGTSIVVPGELPASADSGGFVYTTPGEHTVNGRRWRTSCEQYSNAVYRCRAEIWATQVHAKAHGGYENAQGWVFNNLTYLPSERAGWKGNPLAEQGTFSSGGRKWKTSCGDSWTGPNGCRSFIWSNKVESFLDGTGNRQYKAVNRWVFNNIVNFGTTTTPPEVTSPQGCIVEVEGIDANLEASQNSVTVTKASGSRATVTMIERIPGTSCGTRTVFRDTTGRVGYAGTTPAATRKQDTGTTPAGVFSVKDAFGIKKNPGTTLSWKDVGPNSYWVLDNNSTHNNTWREGNLGGFRKSDSEHLIKYPGQYDYAAVIDYNRSPVVKGKGGAIFLHVHGRGATEGCVSISQANMKTYLGRVTPGDTIIIR